MQALIIFAHGARDPRWAEPFQRLQAQLSAQRPDVPVRLAFLELMAPDLSTVVRELTELGIRQIRIIPAFLGQGGHVRRDLPDQVAQLRELWPNVSLELAQAVGEDATVIEAIAQYCLRQL